MKRSFFLSPAALSIDTVVSSFLLGCSTPTMVRVGEGLMASVPPSATISNILLSAELSTLVIDMECPGEPSVPVLVA